MMPGAPMSPSMDDVMSARGSASGAVQTMRVGDHADPEPVVVNLVVHLSPWQYRQLRPWRCQMQPAHHLSCSAHSPLRNTGTRLPSS